MYDINLGNNLRKLRGSGKKQKKEINNIFQKAFTK
jgi:hypothetical protein